MLYEMEYWNLWGNLPDNAVALDEIWVENDNFVFIHANPQRIM